MWNKVTLTLVLLLITSVAMAATGGAPDLPSIFKPSPNDLSMWYLGNIFGSDLIPGQNVPNQMLLSNLFGVFNQVVLAVGLVIVVYTFLTGTLNTAAEGKAMGEKWHSLWIPIRIATGIGMLIPKAGSGYCMAQYVVIWMAIQGIGAADSIWNTMLDYFKHGGSIYTTTMGNASETNFTYDNMNYTYALQSTNPVGDANEVVSLLRSMVCLDKFNMMSQQDRDSVTYEVYVPSGRKNLLIFGNRKNYDYPNSPDLSKVSGAECGIIKLGTNTGENNNKKTSEKNQHAKMVDDVYISAMQAMMASLKSVAQAMAVNKTDTQWTNYFNQSNMAMQVYINYIVSYSGSLVPQTNSASNNSKANLDLFKDYGWLLAGNYYTLLSHLSEIPESYVGKFIMPSTNGVDRKFEYQPPVNQNSTEDKDTIATVKNYFELFAENPKAMYDAPNSEWQSEQSQNEPTYSGAAGMGSATSPINKGKMKDIQNAVGAINSDQLTGTTKAEVDTFMKYLTGGNNKSLVSQDPILAASQHGKHLTEAAVALMVGFSAAWVAGMLLTSVNTCMQPWSYGLQAAMDIVGPLMVALGAFMYGEGAILGVFVPVIPYLTFLTGAVGYFLSVVESVAAAPIVAIGMVLPETKDEIWGRAAPAYMLTLNLFLRPGLMMIGFAAAMIVTWVAVEILNIGFLTLVSGTFRIENMFGFVTIMMAYTAVFVYLVTEAYSLINVVPNKVLHWIGSQEQGVKGAEEAIGGAKQGAEAGGRSVAAGAGALQTKSDMYRATAHARQAKKMKDDQGTSTKT